MKQLIALLALVTLTSCTIIPHGSMLTSGYAYKDSIRIVTVSKELKDEMSSD